MKVRELKEKLDELPDEANVFINNNEDIGQEIQDIYEDESSVIIEVY